MPEIRLLGAVRKAAGKSSFGIDAGTVEQILEALSRVASPTFREFLFEGDRLRPNVEVMVNDRNIADLDGLKTALTPFDQVTFRISNTRELSGG